MIKKALFVVAHPDDELLGCGGTLLKRNKHGTELGWLLITKPLSNKTWNESFKRHNSPYDQISLNESLFASRVRVLPLTSEWNYFPDLNYFKGKVRNPIILHYTNRISYVIENELLNIAKKTNLNLENIKKKIIERRIERKKKIGRLEWYKLKLCWIVMYNHEKKRLNLN